MRLSYKNLRRFSNCGYRTTPRRTTEGHWGLHQVPIILKKASPRCTSLLRHISSVSVLSNLYVAALLAMESGSVADLTNYQFAVRFKRLAAEPVFTTMQLFENK